MAISIPDLEQRAALGWRAPGEERLGDWLLRAADGFTGRANSALATGHPGLPLDQAAEDATEHLVACHLSEAQQAMAMFHA